jgi:hypothetical protein
MWESCRQNHYWFNTWLLLEHRGLRDDQIREHYVGVEASLIGGIRWGMRPVFANTEQRCDFCVIGPTDLHPLYAGQIRVVLFGR